MYGMHFLLEDTGPMATDAEKTEKSKTDSIQ